MDPGDTALLAARRAVLAELSLGAAHALNNALTAIGGEAGFLESESKDPQVTEACGHILEQVQRCARITRALMQRRPWSAAGPSECELGSVLARLQPTFQDTLSRRLELRIEPSPETLLLALPAEEVETIALLLVQHALLRPGQASCLRLEAHVGSDGQALLELRSAGLGPAGAAAHEHERLLRALLEARGGSFEVTAMDGEDCTRVTLPRLEAS